MLFKHRANTMSASNLPAILCRTKFYQDDQEELFYLDMAKENDGCWKLRRISQKSDHNIIDVFDEDYTFEHAVERMQAFEEAQALAEIAEIDKNPLVQKPHFLAVLDFYGYVISKEGYVSRLAEQNQVSRSGVYSFDLSSGTEQIFSEKSLEKLPKVTQNSLKPSKRLRPFTVAVKTSPVFIDDLSAEDSIAVVDFAKGIRSENSMAYLLGEDFDFNKENDPSISWRYNTLPYEVICQKMSYGHEKDFLLQALEGDVSDKYKGRIAQELMKHGHFEEALAVAQEHNLTNNPLAEPLFASTMLPRLAAHQEELEAFLTVTGRSIDQIFEEVENYVQNPDDLWTPKKLLELAAKTSDEEKSTNYKNIFHSYMKAGANALLEKGDRVESLLVDAIQHNANWAFPDIIRAGGLAVEYYHVGDHTHQRSSLVLGFQRCGHGAAVSEALLRNPDLLTEEVLQSDGSRKMLGVLLLEDGFWQGAHHVFDTMAHPFVQKCHEQNLDLWEFLCRGDNAHMFDQMSSFTAVADRLTNHNVERQVSTMVECRSWKMIAKSMQEPSWWQTSRLFWKHLFSETPSDEMILAQMPDALFKAMVLSYEQEYKFSEDQKTKLGQRLLEEVKAVPKFFERTVETFALLDLPRQLTDQNGRNLAHYAALEGRQEDMNLLFGKGFRADQRDKYGQTPQELYAQMHAQQLDQGTQKKIFKSLNVSAWPNLYKGGGAKQNLYDVDYSQVQEDKDSLIKVSAKRGPSRGIMN